MFTQRGLPVCLFGLWQRRPEYKMSNSSLRFFMSSLGNTDLLERHLVAFFASRSVTPEAESRCIAWAESICNTDSVVISGFHSPLEKRLLTFFLEHKHPVILFLGRAMSIKVVKTLNGLVRIVNRVL